MIRTNLILRQVRVTNDLRRCLACKVDRLRSANFVDVKSLLACDELGDQEFRLRGWINSTVKSMKKMTFFHLNDGLSNKMIQVVMTRDLENSLNYNLCYGSSVICTGKLMKSKGTKQPIEFKCNQIEFAGENNFFPFHNKDQSDDWRNIRELPHLRFKSQPFVNLQRIRSKLFVNIHDHLQKKGYVNVTTPIITINDCEGGGGEAFSLVAKSSIKSTIQNSDQVSEESSSKDQALGESLNENQALDESFNEDSASKDPPDEVEKSESGYVNRYPKKSKWYEYKMSSKEILEKFIPPTSPERSNQFFGKSTFLTVSGQLHLEAVSLGSNRVYTLSPCFRSEGSVSKRHLCEFIMLELEESFLDSLDMLMDNVETLCKDLVRNLLSECKEEIDLILSRKGKLFLDAIIKDDYKRITYEDALKLINEQNDLPKLDYGSNFNRTCEKFLTDHFNNTPVFITHFPSYIKPFYMKTKFDKALNFDLIYPICGEVAGGSLREDDFERMEKLFEIHNLKDLEWYKDLRKEGGLPHGGFGLGVDRFIQAILAIPNIRDVVPFPRWIHHCHL